MASGEKFNGNMAIKLGIVGFIDYTHPALAEFFKDFVMMNHPTDHN
jgi:hypothetical protein